MTSAETPVRVLIADDQALVRAGFRLILEANAGIEVVAEAADGEAAVRLARRHRDLVLMDIRMPALDGLEATSRLLAEGRTGPTAGPVPRVVMLLDVRLDEYVYAALQAARRVPAQGRLAGAPGGGGPDRRGG